MKIFGFDISLRKDAIPRRDIITVEPIPINTKSPTKIPAVQNPVMIYAQSGGFVNRPSKRRGVFEPAEYDLAEISRIEDVDSYVRQAFKKKVGLFLKEGFDYTGKNKHITKYVRTRFAQIARASGIPHNDLIRRLVKNFISKSNAFLVKVRIEEASGGSVRTENGKSLNPVAAYFPVAAETMQVDTDGSGKPKLWRQQLPNGLSFEFKPENVIHFTFDRKEGFLFGTPTLVPVIDDIRALRKIEENIELLVYKHIFPLFQYIVGTEDRPAGITEAGEREIDVVKREIQYMPTEGGIVTPERHKIEAIGAEGRALRAENYLEHFKRRVFAGLGMSAVDYGEGDTSNKSTSDNMSRALVDDVKDFQDAFESQFNDFIINELLLESTFEEDVLLEENKVEIIFREIDIDKQIKVENHNADLFMKHGITWPEYREKLGKDSILVPDDPEMQDLSKFPEWANTHWKLFLEPEKLINAGDEPFSANAVAAAEARSTALTSKSLGAQQEAQTSAEVEKIKAKPKPTRKDNFLNSDYESFKDIVVSRAPGGAKDFDYISKQVEVLVQQMSGKLQSNMYSAFIHGLGTDISNQLLYRVTSTRRTIQDRSNRLIKRLSNDIMRLVRARIDTLTVDDHIPTVVQAIFDSFKYRLDFIANTETTRANNLGRVFRAVYGGADKGKYIVREAACDYCKDQARVRVTLDHYALDSVPPHHPSCGCSIEITEMKSE